MKSDNLIVLVDGSSYLFRAFHGLPKLTSRNGEPTGAIHGVISMIRKLTEEYRPSHIAIVFDAPGKTFRHEMYSEYKAHRPPIDEDLRVQIKPLLQLIESMGYPLLQIEGVEADDVIGTLAHRAVANNLQVLISTGDKDLAQLIDGNTKLLDTMKMQVTDNNNVAQKFKVDALRADQVIDFLTLVGDSADNIPGIPKVGPKTAAKWLAEYDTIENLLAHAESIKGKVGENLRDNLEQLHLSRELAKIKTDVPLDNVSIKALSMNAIDKELFTSLCNRFELSTLKNKLLGGMEQPVSQDNNEIKIDYQLIDSIESFDELINNLQKNEQFSYQVFSNSEHYTNAELIGIGFCGQIGQSYYLPLQSKTGAHLDIKSVFLPLKQLFANKQGKITHDAKFSLHVLGRYGITINNLMGDVMLASYCYNSTASKHGVFENAEKYLQLSPIDLETLIGKGVKQISLAEVEIDKALAYCAQCTDFSLRLHDYFALRVDSMPGPHFIYRHIELPFMASLTSTEFNGILIDCDQLAEQSADLQARIDTLCVRAYEIAGETFNLNSPKQLQEILFTKLNLPVVKKTPKGQPSTDEEVLTELAENHELPHLIVEVRSLSKLKNTYTDRLPENVQPGTGRIHTHYHQTVASTGRLSSSEPNLQNIPIRTEEGRKIRQAIIAPSGYTLLAADYSQIELRIMAHLSKDKGLIEAFNSNKDIHSQTAKDVFSLDNEVNADYRRKAKAINFGLIYGMSAFGLAKQIGVSRSEAGQYIEAYFNQYPGVKSYMENIRVFAKELGHVETIFGRRLYIPDITSTNVIRRNAAERLAINAPMQGTAADIIKMAMNNVVQTITSQNSDIRLIMQIHDELVFEIKNEYVETSKAQIKDCMENICQLDVPLVVDIGVGGNWDVAH